MTSTFQSNGLVTLLTDFGTRDPYVGIVKGVLWSEAGPNLRAIIDLSHEVPPQDLVAAAFFLEHTWRRFPPGTVHVCVVDPGVGSERDILLAECDGHAFLAPDNGVLGPVLADAGARLRRVDVSGLGLAGGSNTFHGRDRFAPLAAWLVAGRVPTELGTELAAPRAAGVLAPRPAPGPGGLLRTRVLWIDRFGNALTDAPGAGGPYTLVLRERTLRQVGTYAEARPGEAVLLVNSYGLIEIAVRDGDARTTFGDALERGTELSLDPGGDPR